jgi:hypothetical protein
MGLRLGYDIIQSIEGLMSYDIYHSLLVTLN